MPSCRTARPRCRGVGGQHEAGSKRSSCRVTASSCRMPSCRTARPRRRGVGGQHEAGPKRSSCRETASSCKMPSCRAARPLHELGKQNGTTSSEWTPSRGAAEPWQPRRSRCRAHAFVLDAGAQEGLALAAATKPRAGQRGGSRGPRQQMQGVRGIGRVATWSLNRAYYRTLVPPS